MNSAKKPAKRSLAKITKDEKKNEQGSKAQPTTKMRKLDHFFAAKQ
jgi:hypothetical protein